MNQPGPGEAGPGPHPDGAVLVRVTADDGSWPCSLPPLPAGVTATVTVSHPRLLEVGDRDLARSGYRLAGAASELNEDQPGEVVDVYVPVWLRRQHASWFGALRDRATQVFDLRFGPVRYRLESVLQLHERRLSTG